LGLAHGGCKPLFCLQNMAFSRLKVHPRPLNSLHNEDIYCMF
jgi:hypothetical protein